MWQIRCCIHVLEHAMKREWNATNGADARGGNPDSRLEKKSPDFVSRFLYAQRMGRVQEETTGYRQRREDEEQNRGEESGPWRFSVTSHTCSANRLTSDF